MTNHPERPEFSELDHVLLSEDPLLPSSGFSASVMSAIGDVTDAPAPLAFPWKLAIPGLAGLAVAVVFLVRLAVQMLRAPVATVSFSRMQTFVTESLERQPGNGSGWSGAGTLLLALVASYLCVWLTRRLTGQSSAS
jgi:hypothetical protein